ncbi:hypothetical protein BJY01DRAFT_195894 [Aspergillus pseudoustus]|uniref:Uncharacterized protein n=1 Tax=Aspergillus pseudoustus TaxID=1810923 RepID=A0ABR4KUD6_9EURO
MDFSSFLRHSHLRILIVQNSTAASGSHELLQFQYRHVVHRGLEEHPPASIYFYQQHLESSSHGYPFGMIAVRASRNRGVNFPLRPRKSDDLEILEPPSPITPPTSYQTNAHVPRHSIPNVTPVTVPPLLTSICEKHMTCDPGITREAQASFRVDPSIQSICSRSWCVNLFFLHSKSYRGHVSTIGVPAAVSSELKFELG